LTGPGPYKIRIRFLAEMVPVNLVAEIQGVGFDYNMSPREVADAVREGTLLVYDKEVTVHLDKSKLRINLAEVPDATQLSAKK